MFRTLKTSFRQANSQTGVRKAGVLSKTPTLEGLGGFVWASWQHYIKASHRKQIIHVEMILWINNFFSLQEQIFDEKASTKERFSLKVSKVQRLSENVDKVEEIIENSFLYFQVL